MKQLFISLLLHLLTGLLSKWRLKYVAEYSNDHLKPILLHQPSEQCNVCFSCALRGLAYALHRGLYGRLPWQDRRMTLNLFSADFFKDSWDKSILNLWGILQLENLAWWEGAPAVAPKQHAA